ncbi:uncharacterized protein N7443_008046 [Penicillium atrosanguineum]|uniref:Beta-glucuronidase C-terminal domain-containing protein n=1 Tax=Penicillium atrosanguineum TaxID=1132637 RepID=A0A9W9U023_9EURO|nr:uncharacterized protein N7443_008046 [Penicillium atrosanguineum]KAJ5297153.1 hypothetical protein N7443_008046 [Penicillium atrosanguineum]KAJ5299913.1 hypothetical protein N7476_011470 [Penicillium atrosanguineum]
MRPVLLAPLGFGTLVYANTYLTVSIPTSSPSRAVAVPADFFSFGFEAAFLPKFANDFSENVVNAIGSRMSKPLIIRVGGTSGDLLRIKEDLTMATHCFAGPGCPDNSKDSFYIGPSYFDGFKRFQNATMTFQAPMGREMDILHTMAYVKNAWNALGKDRVAGIALGNEPGYYHHWTAKQYVTRALEVEDAITKEFNLSGDAASIFEVGDISNHASASNIPFGLEAIFKDGINKNGRGKFAAEHFYTINQEHSYSAKVLQETLMDHTFIQSRLSSYQSSIDYIEKNDPGTAFILSEVGSTLRPVPIDFAGGFGAAIWAVDFHLAAMCRGIKRVSNTQRPEATHAFWVPDDTGPVTKRPIVQGIFPAAAFITDFVGSANLGKASEVSLTGQDRFTAYVIHGLTSDLAERVALVNMKEWNENSNSVRESATITLNVGENVTSATMRRMHADGGSTAVGYDWGGSNNNVSYAGEQWTYAIDLGKGHYTNGSLVEESLSVIDGKIEVSVPDTEAVLLFLK